MSARNSHAAKSARRKARQVPRTGPPIDRARVAAAIHDAVCTVTGTDGYRLCNVYAGAAVAVLPKLTGAPWGLHAGQAVVGTGVDRDNPFGEISYAWTGPDGSDVHAWATRADGTEMADFTLRHWERMVVLSGGSWQREHLPAFYWGSPAGAAAIRMHFRPDRETTAAVARSVTEMASVVENAATLALRSLGVITTAQANRLLSANGAVLLEATL